MTRSTLKAAALLMLTVSLSAPPSWAQEPVSATIMVRAKNGARLPRQEVRADSPPRETVQAMVGADGRVTPLAAKRITGADDVAGSSCPNTYDVTNLLGIARAIAFEEGAPSDVVVAILSVEARIRAEFPSERPDLAMIMPRLGEPDRSCDPAQHIRAGIRRFNALRAKYANPFQLYAAYHAGEEFLRDATGAPTYPATLRFVVAVMNEVARVPVYDTLLHPERWEPPRGARLPESTAVRRRSGPVQGSKQPMAMHEPAHRRGAQGDPRWASGFVLNLE